MARQILVIPNFNEELTIVSVLEQAYPFADMIVVVDDGSTDSSATLVGRWAHDHPGVVLLRLPKNKGMSGALLVGFAYVTRLYTAGQLSPDDVVVNIDADGQHVPQEIPLAMATMTQQHLDVLLGRRSLEGYPWFKLVGNWGLSLWASLLTGYRYYDVECGFRLMRVQVVADLLQYFTGRRYGCAQEIGMITARRGWKVNNRFPTRIVYYRPGARIRDGITNLAMGLLAFTRVVLRLRYHLDERVHQVLAEVVFPDSYSQERPLWSISS